MWICTSFGLLMPAIRPPHTVKAGDDRTMQVRARRAKDLDILRAEFMKGKLGPTLHTPSFDYEYRAYCTPAAFGLVVAKLIEDIDYTKFKPTTYRYEDDELHKCYNAIWSTVLSNLSTKYHQSEYWKKNPATSTTTSYKPGTTGYKPATSGYKPPAPSASATKAATVVPKGATYQQSATGYPKAVESATPKAPAVVDVDSTVLDAEAAMTEQERLDKWYAEKGVNYPEAVVTAPFRDTRADRDYTLPEVDGWDADDSAVFKSIVPGVDELYEQIDEILDSMQLDLPVDHSTCAHSVTRGAKQKCENKTRRTQEEELDILRAEVDILYRNYNGGVISKASAAPSSDPASWKGFPWEGNGRPTAKHTL